MIENLLKSNGQFFYIAYVNLISCIILFIEVKFIRIFKLRLAEI